MKVADMYKHKAAIKKFNAQLIRDFSITNNSQLYAVLPGLFHNRNHFLRTSYLSLFSMSLC